MSKHQLKVFIQTLFPHSVTIPLFFFKGGSGAQEGFNAPQTRRSCEKLSVEGCPTSAVPNAPKLQKPDDLFICTRSASVGGC